MGMNNNVNANGVNNSFRRIHLVFFDLDYCTNQYLSMMFFL